MLLIYVDNTICVYCDMGAMQKLAEELKKSFDITIKGTITDFLGVQFKRRLDGTFALSQPQLIDSILCDLKLIDGNRKKAKPKWTPFKAKIILHPDEHLPAHSASWEYCSVIGKLNFLEKSTR